MTQQSVTSQQSQNMQVIPPVMLPYEISRAVLDATGSLKTLEGVVSGVDTQNERTDLITQAREYLEGGLMNAAALLIGVVFIIAGVYLLFLEFKDSPKSKDVKRVTNDVKRRTASRSSARSSASPRKPDRPRKSASQIARERREDSDYRRQHAKNVGG